MTANLVAALLCVAGTLTAADFPHVEEDDFLIRDFRFQNGQTLPELRLHYSTAGKPVRDSDGVVRNAVLLLHGTGGSGTQFQVKQFAGELFGPGQLLDTREYFVVMPDNIGHGHSSKPSDGLRARFPKYGYRDMVAAQHCLLTERLGINHLRLILGTSMGCMHSRIWGGEYPAFADALMPLACLPYPITGRNYLWRLMTVDLIRGDPAYRDGEYTEQPAGLRAAGYIQSIITSNTLDLQKRGATREQAAAVFHQISTNPAAARRDANDYIWAVESSWDYDPRPGLPKIQSRVYALNFADDPINPPELGIFERELANVPGAKYGVLPATPETKGHGSHTWAVFWKSYLRQLMQP